MKGKIEVQLLFIGHFYPISQHPPKNGVKSALNNISKCLTSVYFARFLRMVSFGWPWGHFKGQVCFFNFLSRIYRAKERFFSTTHFRIMEAFWCKNKSYLLYWVLATPTYLRSHLENIYQSVMKIFDERIIFGSYICLSVFDQFCSSSSTFFVGLARKRQ